MPRSRIFSGGNGSFDRIQEFRRAAGTQRANQALEAYAVDSLRKAAMNSDGTLDASKLDGWRRSHTDALRAFPELDIRISSAEQASQMLAGVEAARKQALDNAQRGALGRLIGTDDPADVSRIIGNLFSRQDAVQQFRLIKGAIGSDEQAQEGLRKAAADFFAHRLVGNTEMATSGQAGIRNDQFQTFIRQNRAGLREVFSDDQVNTLEAIAADLQRSSRSLNAVRIPGQSNTAQDLTALAAGDGPTTVLGKLMTGAMAAGGALAGSVFGTTGSAIGAGGAAIVGALRQRGIHRVDELVRDALLDPEIARVLLTKVPPTRQAEDALLRTMAQRIVKSLTGSQATSLFRNDVDYAATLGVPSGDLMPPQISGGNRLADALLGDSIRLPGRNDPRARALIEQNR